MNLTLDQLKATTVGGTLAHELARMEQGRVSWHQAISQNIEAMQQLRELGRVGSTFSQISKDLAAFRSASYVIGHQYKEFVTATSPIAQAFKVLQESQREQQEHMRKMLEPLADIRKKFMLDQRNSKLIKDAALGATTLRNQFKDGMWAKQIEESRAQTQSVFERLKLGSGISQHLKDFEHINKKWMVSPELLSVVGTLKELQEQIGKVAIPTLDWGSAAALAKLLGKEGIEEQLAHLGIKPDGSLHESNQVSEKGLLSRKQSDAVALLGLLLSIISMWMALQMFYHQENSGSVQQVKNDEQVAKQMRQIESLGRLIEKALGQVARAQEERFVVRERPATVRSRPEHGSAVEGKLMPNEVVRAIDKDGKWVEVEYYHWLHEAYRTGWVLKKYLERVPANYARVSKESPSNDF